MAASAKGRLVPVLAVAAALAAVLLYRAPFSKVPGIMFPTAIFVFRSKRLLSAPVVSNLRRRRRQAAS
jgi:hypothetical protein